MNRTVDVRPLSTPERELIRWLLEHGAPEASRHLSVLDHLQVVGRCECGCASIDVAVGGNRPVPGAPLNVLADYTFRDASGHLGRVFVFERDGVLAGLEVWSIDGEAAINRLPSPDVLVPMDMRLPPNVA